MRSHRIILLTAILASAALAPAPAAAQDSIKGKQIQILVAGTAGGGIDIGARIIARHLGKYLPGNPAIVAQLMPGAGGIRMIDHMNSVAPKDGTVIGITPPGPIIEPLIGKRQGVLPHDRLRCARRHDQGGEPLHLLGRVEVQDHRGRHQQPDGGRRHRRRLLDRHLSGRAQRGAGHQVQGHHRLSGLAGDHHRDRARRGRRPLRLGLVEPQEHQPDWVRDKKINFLLQLALDKSPNIRLAAGDGPRQGPGRPSRC